MNCTTPSALRRRPRPPPAARRGGAAAKDENRLKKRGRNHRIAKADQIHPEEPKRRRVDQMKQARVDVLDVAVEDFARQQPFSDMCVKSVVGGVPVAVVENQSRRAFARQAQGTRPRDLASRTALRLVFQGWFPATRTAVGRRSFRPTPQTDKSWPYRSPYPSRRSHPTARNKPGT